MFADLNVVMVIAGLALAFILAVYAVARRYKKVGPNQVMIISGRKYKIKTPDGRRKLDFASGAAAALLSFRSSRKSIS